MCVDGQVREPVLNFEGGKRHGLGKGGAFLGWLGAGLEFFGEGGGGEGVCAGPFGGGLDSSVAADDEQGLWVLGGFEQAFDGVVGFFAWTCESERHVVGEASGELGGVVGAVVGPAGEDARRRVAVTDEEDVPAEEAALEEELGEGEV